MFKKVIEEKLKELIPPLKTPLFEAARYALLSSGKRFRPSLVLAVTTSLGSDLQRALDSACAIEMIHTYSLIHDDLPCMDDDDLRRGKPTLHKVFPEGIALLTGDYLLTYAFEILSKSSSLSSEQKLQMIQILSHAAGSSGMIGGQAIDLEVTDTRIDETTLLQMHHGKTSALFIAALELGAVVGNAPSSLFSLLEKIGSELGLAYQFLNDLLDVTSTEATVGKKTRRDQAIGKQTAISLYGIEGTIQKIEAFKDSIEKKISQFPNLSPLFQQNLWNPFQAIRYDRKSWTRSL